MGCEGSKEADGSERNSYANDAALNRIMDEQKDCSVRMRMMAEELSTETTKAVPWTRRTEEEAKEDLANLKFDSTVFDYAIGNRLGEGSFASVKAAVDKRSGNEVAVKLIIKDRTNPRVLLEELDVLRGLGQFKNICSLLDTYDTPKAWALVLERAAGGELFFFLCEHPFSESDAATVVQQVGLALVHMHECGVCHRDIKPENILMKGKRLQDGIMVADFGLAVHMGAGLRPLMHDTVGTLDYMAPELLIAEDTNNQAYSWEVDLWSLGVVLFMILSGYNFFSPDAHSNEAEVKSKILHGKINFKFPRLQAKVWTERSEGAKHVVLRLLTYEPCERITAQELLQDPWVQGRVTSTENLSGQNQRLRKYYIARVRWQKARLLLQKGSGKDLLSVIKTANNRAQLSALKSNLGDPPSELSPAEASTDAAAKPPEAAAASSEAAAAPSPAESPTDTAGKPPESAAMSSEGAAPSLGTKAARV